MNRKTTIFWGVFVAAAIIRVAGSFLQSEPNAIKCLRAVSNGIGVVSEDPSTNEKSQILVIEADSLAVDGLECARDIKVRAKTTLLPRYSYGDKVSFSGKLSRPFDFTSDNGRSFDYTGYLAKDGIYYEMRSAQVELVSGSGGSGWSVEGVLFKLKRGFVSNLQKALGEPHAALAAGLVVGEKSALGKELLEAFRVVGLIHIVVLSGFNITIVGVAMRRALSFLPRVWGIVVGGIGIALFGVLVGGGATVIRSCFMAGVALVADLIRRDYSVGRALAFAGLVMLIQNPLILLHDPSFQLSFLATLGLILLAGPIESKLGRIPEAFGIRGTVATCLATQIFVSPYILYMMGQTSVIGIVVNILVLPLIPATMLAVFLTGALGFIHPALSTVAGWGAHILLTYELTMVETFARVPYAAVEVPPFSFWWVVGFYVGFLGIYLWLKNR